MKHHEMVKEERRKQNEETSKMIQKQINEIDELKRSIEDKTAEARRKRTEVIAGYFINTAKVVNNYYNFLEG